MYVRHIRMRGERERKESSKEVHFFLSIIMDGRQLKSLLVHDEVSWLKEVAPSNIRYISVTLLVSKFETSPLKELAPSNIYPIFVTLLVSKFETSPLKEVA